MQAVNIAAHYAPVFWSFASLLPIVLHMHFRIRQVLCWQSHLAPEFQIFPHRERRSTCLLILAMFSRSTQPDVVVTPHAHF